MENDYAVTWSKVASFIVPVILTALVTVLIFLMTQIMGLKEQIADLRVDSAAQYGQLSKDLAIQELRIKVIDDRIERLVQKERFQ